jgi:hypothetical protein
VTNTTTPADEREALLAAVKYANDEFDPSEGNFWNVAHNSFLDGWRQANVRGNKKKAFRSE